LILGTRSNQVTPTKLELDTKINPKKAIMLDIVIKDNSARKINTTKNTISHKFKDPKTVSFGFSTCIA
jgi:hypothetical protein